jgi:ubiquinone/menaquinone biosynthesis C-methylase UbiE
MKTRFRKVMRENFGSQEEVQAYWDHTPCGSELSQRSRSSKEYFLEVENERYKYEGHIQDLILGLNPRNKKILEIGTGVGTDARKIIEQGGIYAGINVDGGSTDLTRAALDTFGLQGSVTQSSATDMNFADQTFDSVYSFGVLHHIPDVGKAVAEIHRVLNSDGQLLLMLYNKNSINYYLEILFFRKIALRILSIPGMIRLFGALGFPATKLARHIDLYKNSNGMSAQEWLSRNTDGPDNPYSRVYDEREVEELLSGRFQILSQDIYFFDYRHWGLFGRCLPRAVTDLIGRKWGWHRIVRAQKCKTRSS